MYLCRGFYSRRRDFLTVTGCFADIRLGGEFININNSPQTEINFPKNNKIRLDDSSSFCYNTPRIEQPIIENLRYNEYFNTWVDVDPITGSANTNTYSNWSIWPKTSGRTTNDRLGAFSYRKYADNSSKISLICNKNIGDTNQGILSVNWSENKDSTDLETYASAPTPSNWRSGNIVTTIDWVTRTDWYPNFNDGSVEPIVNEDTLSIKATDMNLLTKIGRWHIAIDYLNTKNIPKTIVDLFLQTEIDHHNVIDGMIEIFHISSCAYISNFSRYMQRLTIFATSQVLSTPLIFVRNQLNSNNKIWCNWIRLNTIEDETANPSTQESSVSPLNEYNGIEYADGCYPDEYYTNGITIV